MYVEQMAWKWYIIMQLHKDLQKKVEFRLQWHAKHIRVGHNPFLLFLQLAVLILCFVKYLPHSKACNYWKESCMLKKNTNHIKQSKKTKCSVHISHLHFYEMQVPIDQWCLLQETLSKLHKFRCFREWALQYLDLVSQCAVSQTNHLDCSVYYCCTQHVL